MTQSGNFKFHTPIFRVNNRQENIDFYQNTLGFKLLTEENALAVFTDWTDRNSLFVIEESPAYRCRAVEGPKKINWSLKFQIHLRLNTFWRVMITKPRLFSKGKRAMPLKQSHLRMVLF